MSQDYDPWREEKQIDLFGDLLCSEKFKIFLIFQNLPTKHIRRAIEESVSFEKAKKDKF
jgi:hypothetical protein